MEASTDMSQQTITIKVDASPAISYFRKMLENTRSYAEPLREGTVFLKTAFGTNFDSEGSLVGGWKPLDPKTSAWRVEEGFPPFGPILVNTGGLRAAVFGARTDVGRKEASVTVEHRLATFHQYGSTKVNLPAREIVFEPAGFAKLMAERLKEHILPNGESARLRNLFKR